MLSFGLLETMQALRCALCLMLVIRIPLHLRTFVVLTRLRLTATDLTQLILVRAIAVWRTPFPSTPRITRRRLLHERRCLRGCHTLVYQSIMRSVGWY